MSAPAPRSGPASAPARRWERWQPSAWPITIKAPLMVAVFMIGVGVLASHLVLTRLAETQERHLRALTAAYLDGLSSSLIPHVLREDVWEVFDVLDRARSLYGGIAVRRTIVLNGTGQILAASDPARFPTGTALPAAQSAVFAARAESRGEEPVLVVDANGRRAHVRRDLVHQGRKVGSILADIDISDLIAERNRVLATLALTNGALILAMAVAGYFAIRRIVRPVRTLADHLERSRQGRIGPIPRAALPPPHSEFGHLFRRYNALVQAVDEREALARRLAEEERLASLGRLTSGMAHEINNPLGGLFNALYTLKHHGEKEHVRLATIRLLERGLGGIRDVVRAALMAYRDKGQRRVLARGDLEDLRVLIGPETKRRRLTLKWNNAISGQVSAPVAPIRQALLNLLLNACAATPEGGTVSFEASANGETLRLVVSDTGSGLPDRYRAFLESEGPITAPIVEGSGLGLWLVRRLVDEVNGQVAIGVGHGVGTRITLSIPLDREALRDVA